MALLYMTHIVVEECMEHPFLLHVEQTIGVLLSTVRGHRKHLFHFLETTVAGSPVGNGTPSSLHTVLCSSLGRLCSWTLTFIWP